MMQDLLTKFKFYQEIQLWPKAADFNYEGWLENFDSDERALAEKIIDFFVYIPDDITNQLFRTVIGKAGLAICQERIAMLPIVGLPLSRK